MAAARGIGTPYFRVVTFDIWSVTQSEFSVGINNRGTFADRADLGLKPGLGRQFAEEYRRRFLP